MDKLHIYRNAVNVRVFAATYRGETWGRRALPDSEYHLGLAWAMAHGVPVIDDSAYSFEAMQRVEREAELYALDRSK